MRYYIVSGEASGDLHGAHLARALAKLDPEAVLHGWGGEHMEAAEVTVEKHFRDLAFMGFVEVVRNLPAIYRNWRFIKQRLKSLKPDALILIDYPGFNLRLARWAHAQGMRVFYFISPQLWAWHTSRVKIIRRCVERMYVIFPFEKDFYAKHGVEVEYHGHPLIDVIDGWRPSGPLSFEQQLDPAHPLVALLPGSRRQEIERILPAMLEIVPYFPQCQFAVAGASGVDPAFYKPFLQNRVGVFLVHGQTYALLSRSSAALVTSGTATLETALLGVPQVVCYKAGNFSYRLARMLVNPELKHIAIVNLIAGRTVVPELIQDDLNPNRLQHQLGLLFEPNHRQEMLEGYALVRKLLGPPGAANRVAESIVKRLKQKTG